MQYFSFSLTACLFSIFGLVVEREKFGKGDKVMYRLGKEQVVSCSAMLERRWDGVSNSPECGAVCSCHGGDKLWKQQDKHKMRQLSTSKRSTICLRRLSANVGRWTVRHTLSAVILREGRISREQWNGLPLGRRATKMRGETV